MNNKSLFAIIAVCITVAITGAFIVNAATSLPAGAIIGWNGSNFVATGTPQVYFGGITATSSTATNVLMGKTGIGSSTPWALLSVNPTALGSGVPEFAIGSSTATHFVVDGFGKVGLGTALPGRRLTLVDNGAPAGNPPLIGFQNSGGSIAILGLLSGNNTIIGGDSNGEFNIYTPANFDIYTGNVFRLVVTSTGLVGISTSTPSRALSVQGSGLISGDLSLANLTATGTILTSNLTVTGTLTGSGTGTSTFAGPVSVPNFAITTQSSGCAQFGAGGYLLSTGSACGSGGGGSSTIYPTIASTSIPSGSYPLSTTTPVLAGEQVTIWMNCTRPNASGGTIWHLNANNGQGTTTIGYSQMQNSGGNAQNMSLTMFGTFTATTTNPVRLSWSSSDDTAIVDSVTCTAAFQFTIQRVHPS